MAMHRPTGLATAPPAARRALRKIVPFRTSWIPADLEHRNISDAVIERNPVRVRSKRDNSCTLLLIPREAQAFVDPRCPVGTLAGSKSPEKQVCPTPRSFSTAGQRPGPPVLRWTATGKHQPGRYCAAFRPLLAQWAA